MPATRQPAGNGGHRCQHDHRTRFRTDRAALTVQQRSTSVVAHRLRPIPIAMPHPDSKPDVRHHRSDDRSRLCTERHPNADLGPPLRNRVRGDAVQPHRRQHERESAKERRQHRDHAVVGERFIDLLREWFEGEGDVWTHSRDR